MAEADTFRQTSALFQQAAKTLAAATAQMLLPANPARRYLLIQNTGVGVMSVGLDAAPVAGGGVGLDPAEAAGGQGGAYECAEIVPTNAIWGISTAGTTCIAWEA